MKQNYTHIEVIVDQSGSMLNRKTDVIGGFNNFIKEQQQLNGECTVSLTLFSDKYHRVYSMKPLKSVSELTARTYKPGGNTALLYTMIQVIDGLGAELGAMEEHQRPDRVVVVTITDGEENHSYTHEPSLLTNGDFTRHQVFNGLAAGSSNSYMQLTSPPSLIDPQPGTAINNHPPSTLQLNPIPLYDSTQLLRRIKEQSEVYSWTFVYLGANHDAFAAGSTMGYSMSNTLNYAASAKGFHDAFASTSSNLREVRTSSRDAYLTKSKAFFVDADQQVQNANLAATT
ncbi:MAG: VWA domain-containing protein [Nitrosomonadaceae bacterium]|nr:VWA domain-containing protein [Nitrosomonadaceae bacterium]